MARKKKKKKKAAENGYKTQHERHGDPGAANTGVVTIIRSFAVNRERPYDSYYTGAKRVSRLHDLLSCHHGTNGEGVQMPVGDISQVGGWECRLGRPHTRLQNLVDHAVLLEEQRRRNLSGFVGPNSQRTTILFRGRRMSQGDDWVKPKGNDVTRDPLLNTARGNEEALNPRTKAFNPWQVGLFPEGSNGAEKELVPVTSNKVIQGWDGEFLEARVRHRKILCFGHEVTKERKSAWPPTLWMTNPEGEAVQLTNSFSWHKSK